MKAIRIFALGLVVAVCAAPARAGVVLGRLPDAPSADLRGLEWKIEGDTVRLVLLAAGPGDKIVRHESRPVPAQLMRQALRYAADGRPLTVTMITAKPLMDLKVLLHPALVDTGAGRLAIRLDQLADEHSSSAPRVGAKARPAVQAASKARGEAMGRALGQAAAYELFAAQRVVTTSPAVIMYLGGQVLKAGGGRAKALEGMLAEVRFSLELAKQSLASPATRASASKFLGLPADRGSDLFAKKPEFFDPALVGYASKKTLDEALKAVEADAGAEARAVTAMLKQEDDYNAAVRAYNADVEAFNNSVRFGALRRNISEARRQSAALKDRKAALDVMALRLPGARLVDRLKGLMKAATHRAPRTIPWSGVRERPFKGEVADYVVPARYEKWPFRFMVQVAFQSAPEFLKVGKPEDYSDESPFELAGVEGKLEAAIRAGAEENLEVARCLDRMAAFVTLQRLFRAGLAGKLGDKFPAARLTALARALGPVQAEPVRTMRFLARTGSLEQSAQFALVLAGLGLKSEGKEGEAAKVLKECSKLVAEKSAARKALVEATRRADAAEAALALAGRPLMCPLGVGRELAWRAHLRFEEGWLRRWTAAAKLKADDRDSEAVKKARATLAELDASFQVRARMRVVDDERP